MTDLGARASNAAVAAGLTDLHQVELDAFLGCLVTSFGLRALRVARASGSCSAFLATSQHKLEFYELPRADLLCQLEASTGLRPEVCDKMLEAMEREIQSHLPVGGQRGNVEIEHIGRWCRGDEETTLLLNSNLVVAPK